MGSSVWDRDIELEIGFAAAPLVHVAEGVSAEAASAQEALKSLPIEHSSHLVEARYLGSEV